MAPKKRLGSRLTAALGRLVGFVAVSAVCGVLAAGLVGPSVAAGAVTVNNSITYFNSLPGELTVDSPSQSTRMVTADGQSIATFYAENRVRVTLDQMSPYIKNAIIAIEDSRFYEHAGIDPQGILRALTYNFTQGDRQGASTLTQQYVTNVINESHVSADKPTRSSSAAKRRWATSCGR